MKQTTIYEHTCTVTLCGIEPNGEKAFETIGGIAVDKNVRARIADGALVLVKKPAQEALKEVAHVAPSEDSNQKKKG